MEEVNKILRRQADAILNALHGMPAEENDEPLVLDCGTFDDKPQEAA
jgi:hypothetical protein